MYVWDTATPYRDGDIEAGIVIHELSHGLSTRITGGPDNSGCLGYGEAGGMGEGWGDALATLIRQVEEHKQFKNGTDVFSMGAWAANRVQGIRNYEYSTNSTINPSTYKTLDKVSLLVVGIWTQANESPATGVFTLSVKSGLRSSSLFLSDSSRNMASPPLSSRLRILRPPTTTTLRLFKSPLTSLASRLRSSRSMVTRLRCSSSSTA